MNRHIKINNKLFLVEVPVTRPSNGKSEKQITANNHMWIFDRSGSMSGTLYGLVDDMIAKLPTLDVGDTLTVGWFSGEGQRDFIFKGLEIKGPDSYKKIAEVLNKYKYTVGCTCFSEILHQTDQVIADLAAFNNLFSLVFFTDGYPVVSNYQRELSEITRAIDRIKGKLTSVLLVGYGAYYNKELLADMTGRFGGTLIHSANLAEYSKSLTEFMEDAKLNGGRVTVKIPHESLLNTIISINNKTVVAYRADDKGEFSFVMPRTGKSSFYMLRSDTKYASTVETSLDNTSDQRAIYAAALSLTQRTKTDIALELLGALGDVALIDGVTNSFTNDEYGRIEAKIRAAVAGPAGRFTAGRDPKHLPKRDAFCLIDVIALLIGDENVRFLPYSDDFKYNRIGLKTVAKDGVKVKFEAEKNPAVEIVSLTWNDEMLNLSLTCRIPGKVELDGRAEKFGFAKKYPTFIWRSYSVVKDGNANVSSMPLLVSFDTYHELKKQGVVDDSGWQADKPVTLHLDRVPVMNRAIADGRTSANEMITKAIEAMKLEFKINALKKIKAGLESVGAKNFASRPSLSEAQSAYLKEFYIGFNGFQPPSEEVDPTDHYSAKEFTIKVKNFSTIPKMKDVEEKLRKISEANGNGKVKLTPSEELYAEGLKWIDKNCGRQNLTSVTSTLSTLTAQVRGLNKEIQKTKFAILLGKRWFDEFDSREECTVKHKDNGTEFTATFNLREVEVPV